MEPGNNDGWDVFIEGTEAYVKARAERAERAQRQALEAEQRRQDEAARLKRQQLENEARAKAWRDAQAKAQERAFSEKEAYHQKMIDLAEAVDLDGIMAELDHILSDPDHRFYQAMDWIRYGLQVAASKAPHRLYAFLGARKAAFEGFLLIRSQIMAMNAIRDHDAKAGPPYYGELPKAVLDIWIPRLENIGKSVSDTVSTFSRADHALKLAGGKKTGRKGEDHGRDEQTRQRTKSSGTADHGEQTGKAPDHPPAPAENAGGAEASAGAPGQPAAA